MKARIVLILLTLLALLIVPHLWMASRISGFPHWSQARWDSAGIIAADPASTEDAVVQVYAARAWGWKGVFAVHSWVALKHAGSADFDRYEVVGWGVSRGAPAVRKNRHAADGFWAGNPPELLLDLRGPEVEALVLEVERAIENYPYPQSYVTWPGPNSNSFTAHVGRQVPALGLELPPTAVGKDFLDRATFTATTPSGSGYQLSMFGVLGLSLSRDEGIELHVLGLTLGLDLLELAVKLPGLGRIGFK
ncbi:MAG: DUF3750 domain-containing protein [Alphaproteobacteria bacterium]|nr:DUF3750 domain-containing protein [Alphaproteobacteria bacterium]